MNPKIEPIIRFVLALILAIFGANKFLGFLAMPPPPPEGGEFLGALMNAGYIFPFIGGVFLVVAVLLVTNRCVPFGLILLAPIIVNILMYHLRFAPGGIVAGAVIGILTATLAWIHRSSYCSLFVCKSCHGGE